MVGYGSSLADTPEIEWDQLADQPWTLPLAGSSIRRRFDDLARHTGVPRPRDMVETNFYLAMMTLLRER